ncbi:catalase family protein [Paraburkholderia acidisoli]|uniref:Catalase n=1 Tax=Paraburkholderia acidisoli TaxID=2571748 RepID=A0A7Z2GSL1_9BURK|nr:catalase family protein [Paraburkholderia acidisoli]QGZ67080.1 catalase [Paraburkholderia acidisoli]
MSTPLAARPLSFDASFERIPDDEVETIGRLVKALRSIQEITSQDYGRAVRSVHAKSHGVLEGELTVFDNLPPELAQGVFALPREYRVAMRLSTNPGDILHDGVSTPRGLAIKIADVTGVRLPGSEAHTSQDFVMVNAPMFTAATPKAFVKNLELLAKTTDRMPKTKKALSTVLRGVEHVVETLGGESGKIKSLGGHPETHILGETFYACAPLLYGPYFAKLSIAPVSPELVALKDASLDTSAKPDALREAVTDFFAVNSGEWELRVQLATDIDKMPVEDASVQWPENESPYLAVARIRVAPQPTWTEQRVAAIDDGMVFSPWHGIAAHRPIGGVMRARKLAYEMSAAFRAEFNGCPVHG